MNKQSKGYPRYQNKTSIFFDWLQAQPDPRKARFPSGHLARKQNKYLQLSSSLFGDQEERDRIRGSREEANKDYLLRQEKETEYYAKQQQEEDERLFAAMSLGPSKGNRVSNTYPSSQKSSKGSYQPSFLDTEHKSQRSVSENASNGTHKKSELQSRSLESGFVQPTSTSRLQEIKTANPSNQPRPKNPNPNPHSQDLKLPVSHPKGIPHLVYLQPHPSYSKSAHRPQPPANYPLAFQYPPIDEGGNNLSYPPPVVYLLPQQPPPPVYPQTNQLHYPSKRELEKERLAFLRHQVEEKRILEEERRLKEIYDDQLVEQNVLRQREKLRLEYEADLAKQQAKDRAASKKQDEHIAKIASLEREAEEAKRVKFASRGRRPKNSSSTPGATPEIPRIVIDTVDDRPIKPTKKTRKGSSVDKPKSSIKPKSSNTKSSKKKSASKNLPSVAMPRAGTAMPPRTGMGQSNIRKSSSHGEVTKLQYHPENNEEINIQEKNGKRRKLPSRRTDDFGMHIQSASKPIVVNDETLTSTIYDAKIRPRPRKKPLPARLRNTPSETESRFTPRSAPLPPITRTEESPERPATDPSPSSTRETDAQSKYEDPPRRPVLMSAGIQTDAWEEKDKSKDIDDTGMGMEEFNLDELEEGDHHPFTDEENRDSPTPPPTERVATPPPFDWRIQIEKEEADKEGHEEQKKKKMKKFKKKNVGFLSQLSALRKGLKQPADNDDDDGDDDDDDDDISDEKGEEKEEEKQKENEEEDANNDSNDDLEDDFNRKVSLGDTHRLDLEATNKTILRNFMTRANQSKTASTSE